MTEAAQRVEPNASSIRDPPLHAAKAPALTRLADPDWVDWCDADR